MLDANGWKTRSMRLLFLCWATMAHSVAAHLSAEEIIRPEGARHYMLALTGTLPTRKLPLVILLHGHGGSAAQLLGQGHGAAPLAVWLDIADREGLVVMAIDGMQGADGKQGWNDCRRDAGSNPHTDDVGLVACADRSRHC